MDRRHALLMLALVLVVSLLSFGLGIMVGKSGAPPAPLAGKAPPVTQAPEPVEPQPEAAAPAIAEKDPQLTFYETLAETRKPPLGSGINLPPETKKPEPEKPQPVAVEKQASPPPAPKAKVAPGPQGHYAVQTGSFTKAEDALQVKRRLAARGYDVFIKQVDLGDKGVWYRVLVGPAADKSKAQALAVTLKNKENIAGFVRKM